MKSIIVLLVMLTVSQAQEIRINEYKIISDSIDLPRLGIGLFTKYHFVRPRKPCLTDTTKNYRDSLGKDMKLVNTKTEEIGNNKYRSYYEIFKKEKKIYEFNVDVSAGLDVIHGQYSWGNNWAIEYYNHVVINGQEVNKLNNYQKSYGLRFMKNELVYFFERDNELGITIGNKEHFLNYKTALHYLCCEYSIFNPSIFCNVQFIAKRNGYWYYIIIEKEKG